jgi:hypothetical protein
VTHLQTTQGSSTLQNLMLSYDTMGDRTGQADSVSGTSLTLGYNQADELITYGNAKTGVNASYAYNGDGLRTGRTLGNTTTSEVWDLAVGMPSWYRRERLLACDIFDGTAIRIASHARKRACLCDRPYEDARDRRQRLLLHLNLDVPWSQMLRLRQRDRQDAILI